MIAQTSPISTRMPQRLYPMFMVFLAPALRQSFILPGNRSSAAASGKLPLIRRKKASMYVGSSSSLADPFVDQLFEDGERHRDVVDTTRRGGREHEARTRGR